MEFLASLGNARERRRRLLVPFFFFLGCAQGRARTPNRAGSKVVVSDDAFSWSCRKLLNFRFDDPRGAETLAANDVAWRSTAGWPVADFWTQKTGSGHCQKQIRESLPWLATRFKLERLSIGDYRGQDTLTVFRPRLRSVMFLRLVDPALYATLEPLDHYSDFMRSLDADVVQSSEIGTRYPPEIAETAVAGILERFEYDRPEVDSVLGELCFVEGNVHPSGSGRASRLGCFIEPFLLSFQESLFVRLLRGLHEGTPQVISGTKDLVPARESKAIHRTRYDPLC